MFTPLSSNKCIFLFLFKKKKKIIFISDKITKSSTHKSSHTARQKYVFTVNFVHVKIYLKDLSRIHQMLSKF